MMTAAISNNNAAAGADQQKKAVTIFFACQPLARLLCCCSGIASAPWYMGRGRPDDDYLPAAVDIWIWGGISLVTERILMTERAIQGTSAEFGYVILYLIYLFLNGIVNRFFAIGGIFVTWACICSAAYNWRIQKVSQAVKEEISPKLRSIGYDVSYYQRPWFSYYKITPIDENERINLNRLEHDHYQGFEDHVSTLMEPISFPLVGGGHCWDWQGYTCLFPTFYNDKILDAWTWGGFVETVRGRVVQAEDESPPLIELRRLRHLRMWTYVAFYGTLFFHYTFPDINDFLAIPVVVLLLLVMVTLCYARCWGTLVESEPLQEIAKEIITDLGPIIEDRTGCTLYFESRGHGCVWISEASSVEPTAGSTLMI